MVRRTGAVAAIVAINMIFEAHAAVFCPQIVRPVCGLTSSGALQSFTNSCFAQNAGATVLHAGRCNGAFCPQSCVADRAAVGRQVTTGRIKTYDNVCWAEKDHAVFLQYGKCPWQLGQ